MNPCPDIFPELIELWNKNPALYRQRLVYWLNQREQNVLLEIIHEWIVRTNYPVYLND